MQAQRETVAIALCLVATALFTWLDLWTKDWAVDALTKPQPIAGTPVCAPDENGAQSWQRVRVSSVELVPDYLELRYAENCGAAFGLLDEAPRWLRVGVFMSAGTLAAVALLFMFVRGNGGPLFAWSVPLVVSGALGNMVDRVRLGYVVDFIHFHIHDRFEWPTFNVADSTITVGVALLLLDGLRRPAPARPPADASAAEREQETRA